MRLKKCKNEGQVLYATSYLEFSKLCSGFESSHDLQYLFKPQFDKINKYNTLTLSFSLEKSFVFKVRRFSFKSFNFCEWFILSSSACCTWSFAVSSSDFSSFNSCSFFKVPVPEIQHGINFNFLKVDYPECTKEGRPRFKADTFLIVFFFCDLLRPHDWSSFDLFKVLLNIPSKLT